MRTIKFRGRDIKTNEWIIGQWYGGAEGFPNGYIVTPVGDEFIPHTVSKETLGQFTGLKDKNGVEIYEGDIVEYVTLRGEVIWDELMWRPFWFDSEYGWPVERCSVIGNIYENPELLEKE